MTNKELSPRLAPWLKYVHTADFNLEVLKNCILFAELCHLKLILKITQDMDSFGKSCSCASFEWKTELKSVWDRL